MIPEPPQWSEIENLFFEALQIPVAEREHWIARAAKDREELAREVLTLLEAHEASESALPQRRIGPYRLERRIGRGGMGEVWLAARADGQFEQRVAIKLVRGGLGVELLLPRFQQERQLLARLNHPNIARLLDGGISPDGRPYLAMEYVEGEPILDFCEHRRLDLRTRIELFRQLCGAVEYAHHNLIVHRDIKPGNVLVTPDGSPKLLDFGVAKLMRSEPAPTLTALPMLTPRYASPEQLRGDPVTVASDVYSLGVLLFELLTGTLPKQAEDNTPVASRTSDRVPRGDLDAVLARALEKDPAARYGSVGQFSADLDNYLRGRPVTARPLTARYRLDKYLRRHWAGVAAAAVVAVGLAMAVGMSVRAARLAALQQVRSERVTQFLEDMLGSVDPGWEGTTSKSGSDIRVLDLLPEARARIATVFANDPAAQARLHRVIGRAYTSLQQFPDAETEIKAALNLLPALENDPAEKAKVLFDAGDLDFLLSHRYEEENELRQALEIFEHTPELARDPIEHAIYVATFATALADVGKKQEAERYADRAARLLESVRSPFPVRTGIIHANVALVYMKIGRLAPARAEERLAAAQLSLSPKPVAELAQVYEALETIERFLGNPTDARVAAERGVEAALRTAGTDKANDPLTVAPRIELAYVQALAGDTARAIPELSRCLAQARAASSQEDLFHALHSLGYVLTLAGRPREGEPLLREAMELGPHFLSKSGPSMGICNLELGECLERQGRGAEARGFYQTAYNNLRSYYGPVYITREAQTRLQAVSGITARR